jgi:hypothetical protein
VAVSREVLAAIDAAIERADLKTLNALLRVEKAFLENQAQLELNMRDRTDEKIEACQTRETQRRRYRGPIILSSLSTLIALGSMAIAYIRG